MVVACGLTNENTRLVFSSNNQQYKNTCKGITNGKTTDPVKKINFYTSTCFEGCDLYDNEGKIYIVSESGKAHTLLDISTQVKQIAGRIRDTQYFNHITHYYKETRYSKYITFDEYKATALQEAKKAESYVEKVNSDPDLLAGTKESVYPYLVKNEEEPIRFEFDPNRVMLDIYNFKCTHYLYSLNINLVSEYEKAGMIAQHKQDKVTDKLLKNLDVRITFKDAIKEYDNIMERKRKMILCLSDSDRLSLLRHKYPFIKQAYKLGMDRIREMKYNVTNIKRVLIIEGKNTPNVKVAELLKTMFGFNVGEFLSSSTIKEGLQSIYNKVGINAIAKATDLELYANLREHRIRKNGKQIRGYVITYIKII